MTDYLHELSDLPPINRGVGWYWRRCGELGVVKLDCPEAVESPLLGYAIVDDGRFDVAGWSKDGSFGLGGDDLVIFIGPNRPEQATYNEWRAAEVAEPLLDWWCVKNSYGAQHFDTLAEAKLFARGRASHKIIHMREVREPSTSEPSDAEWDGNPQDGELTDAEATAAYDAAEPVPLSSERIQEIVKYATGKDYKPVEPIKQAEIDELLIKLNTPPNEQLREAAKQSEIPASYFDSSEDDKPPFATVGPSHEMAKAAVQAYKDGDFLRTTEYLKELNEPAEPAEPVAERELLELWVNVYPYPSGYHSHHSKEMARLQARETDKPLRTAVHVREVPDGDEVRCWVRVGKDGQILQPPAERLVDRWVGDDEVVECVGYRRKEQVKP